MHVLFPASVFLTRFLSSCYSLKMAEIPLVFVTFALSKLPPQPLLGAEALAGIRYVYVCTYMYVCRQVYFKQVL